MFKKKYRMFVILVNFWIGCHKIEHIDLTLFEYIRVRLFGYCPFVIHRGSHWCYAGSYTKRLKGGI